MYNVYMCWYETSILVLSLFSQHTYNLAQLIADMQQINSHKYLEHVTSQNTTMVIMTNILNL